MAGILFVPETTPGAGTGHLRRCIDLCKRFAPRAAVYLPSDARSELVQSVVDELGSRAVIRSTQTFSDYRAIVLDRPVVQRREFIPWLRHSIVIGLDAGGNGRDHCSYTIDVIPRLRDNEKVNVRDIGLLELPRAVRASVVTRYTKALVTFGGEDPRNLTPKMVAALLRSGEFERQNITVVRGPLARWKVSDELRVLERPSNLKDVLKEFDIVFTSFGLTAFEAAAAGATVVLLNPTRYHARLSRRVGFADIGVGTPRIRKIRALLQDSDLGRRCARLTVTSSRRELADLLHTVSRVRHWGCPVCRRTGNPAILRDPARSFFRCTGCGMVYREAFMDSGIRYDEGYFCEEYRRQYGRTYLDDYNAIRETGMRRATRMAAMLGRHKRKRAERQPADLLDVGCAYGPFLDAAHQKTFRVVGLDVARVAVRYVRHELRFAVVEGSVEDRTVRERWQPQTLDALSMWYVIEHLQDLRWVLRWVSTVLRDGGVFAFSTPNGAGISGLLHKRRLLRNSPADHVTVWTPRTARRVLRRFGLRAVRVVVTGHHPERFPGCSAVKPGSALYRLLHGASRVLRLGDTFEVYARRMPAKR
ncbi:MAG: methyltransferase domain-containing protein [Spirochaetaceae bacterium]|nr:MAG: methyltransferase domain-containing protein [Spirochaetaceae bacterium]